MRTELSKNSYKKEKILSLGRRGFTYSYIAKRLNVSKGSVSYHLGKGQKEKTKARRIKNMQGMFKKVENFNSSGKGKKLRGDYVNNPIVQIGSIRKKARNFVYGFKSRVKGRYTMNKKELKYQKTKIWDFLNKVWPGITRNDKYKQAVNQWTGLPDYEKGIAVMYPMVRCKLTDKIVNAEFSDVHCDHADGDRRNNHVDNFTLVSERFNLMKGRDSYKEFYENCNRYIEIYDKYRL